MNGPADSGAVFVKGENMKRILCFGDSNTWGHDPVDCSRLERRWTVMLRERLSRYDIEDDGLCGRAAKTFTSEMADTNGIETFGEKYVNGSIAYDLIIIMLGTNDVLNSVNSTPEEIAETLSEYISEYRQKHADDNTKFLVVSPILLRDNLLSHSIFSELYSKESIEKSKRFASCLSAMAQQEGAYFMNAADFASASEIDGIHMESAEHEKLAAAMENKIEEILGQ